MCTQVSKFSAPHAERNAKREERAAVGCARETVSEGKTVDAQRDRDGKRNQKGKGKGCAGGREGAKKGLTEGGILGWTGGKKSKLQVFDETLDWSDVTKVPK